MRKTLCQCRYVRLWLTKNATERVPSLAGVLILQGKYNDKEKEKREHCASRRKRPSLNLHFQHFARRQITTSLRRSSDINDIFDLRRRRRRPSSFPVSFVVVIFVPATCRLPQLADDNGCWILAYSGVLSS